MSPECVLVIQMSAGQYHERIIDRELKDNPLGRNEVPLTGSVSEL